MRPRNPSSYRCRGGSRSDVSICLAAPVTLRLNVWFKSLMTSNTPEAKHDHQLKVPGLVCICRLPNYWCIQDLCPWLPEQPKHHRSTCFQHCPLAALWPEEEVTMDWFEGLGWAGVTAVGACLLWDLLLPLNLLIIGVIYTSSFICWLFLTRKKTMSWGQCVIFQVFSEILPR